MNIPLLRKIQEAIKHHPSQFNMASWASRDRTSKQPLWCWPDRTRPMKPECGTAYCIGGWACALSHVVLGSSEYFHIAKQLLGLTNDQATRLFHASYWPEQFQYDHDGLFPSPTQAIARIDHFIATGGAE